MSDKLKKDINLRLPTREYLFSFFKQSLLHTWVDEWRKRVNKMEGVVNLNWSGLLWTIKFLLCLAFPVLLMAPQIAFHVCPKKGKNKYLQFQQKFAATTRFELLEQIRQYIQSWIKANEIEHWPGARRHLRPKGWLVQIVKFSLWLDFYSSSFDQEFSIIFQSKRVQCRVWPIPCNCRRNGMVKPSNNINLHLTPPLCIESKSILRECEHVEVKKKQSLLPAT